MFITWTCLHGEEEYQAHTLRLNFTISSKKLIHGVESDPLGLVSSTRFVSTLFSNIFYVNMPM